MAMEGRKTGMGYLATYRKQELRLQVEYKINIRGIACVLNLLAL